MPPVSPRARRVTLGSARCMMVNDGADPIGGEAGGGRRRWTGAPVLRPHDAGAQAARNTYALHSSLHPVHRKGDDDTPIPWPPGNIAEVQPISQTHGTRYGFERRPFYPTSGKVGLFAGRAPGGPREARFLAGFLRMDATVDYWEGEKWSPAEGRIIVIAAPGGAVLPTETSVSAPGRAPRSRVNREQETT